MTKQRIPEWSRAARLHFMLAIAAVIGFTGCAHSQAPGKADLGASDPTFGAERLLTVDLRQSRSLAEIVADLDDHRVLYVGETHTRYDHHLMQLAVIRAAHRRSADLAIGVEWFQRPFQPHLDDYVAGRIDEAELLGLTGYYQRWRFDYRLYRPIVRYAREHGIPLIALNASSELIDEISDSGTSGVSDALRDQLPAAYDRSDQAYTERLRSLFDSHPGGPERRFDRFLDVQLTWDESMAETAADYLSANPQRRMIVLAGSGHVAYRSGIPNRLQRRLPELRSAVILAGESQWNPEAADYLVLSQEQELPPPGLLGAFLDDRDSNGLRITGFSAESPLQAAGVSEGDVLLGIDGNQLKNFAALKIALIDSRPGDIVQVSYEHTDWLGRKREKTAPVTLQGQPRRAMHP